MSTTIQTAYSCSLELFREEDVVSALQNLEKDLLSHAHYSESDLEKKLMLHKCMSRRNDRTLFKTASLQVRFFAINDIIASVVAVKFGKAFCYGQELTSGNSCAKFCLVPINTDRGV